MGISFIAAGDVFLSSFACSSDVFPMANFFFLNAETRKSHNIIHYNGFLLLEIAFIGTRTKSVPSPMGTYQKIS